MRRAEIVLAWTLFLAFVLCLSLMLHGCSTAHGDVHGERSRPWCRCYASAQITADGGVCVWSTAGCDLVCTCDLPPPCTEQVRPRHCVGRDKIPTWEDS